jgi:hypothetical protein
MPERPVPYAGRLGFVQMRNPQRRLQFLQTTVKKLLESVVHVAFNAPDLAFAGLCLNPFNPFILQCNILD